MTALKYLRKPFGLLVAMVVMCSVIYPVLTTGIGYLLFPYQAKGSLIVSSEGKLIGSPLIAQPFQDPKYFHPRPSSAGKFGYDGIDSGSSNIAVHSMQYRTLLKDRAQDYRTKYLLDPNMKVPLDALTTSASGLDPHISLSNALLQAKQVGQSRQLPLETVISLIHELKEGPLFSLLGEERVNVLLLNLKLDNLSERHN